MSGTAFLRPRQIAELLSVTERTVRSGARVRLQVDPSAVCARAWTYRTPCTRGARRRRRGGLRVPAAP